MQLIQRPSTPANLACKLLALCLLAAAALATAFLNQPAAHAQQVDNDYVDVAMALEFRNRFGETTQVQGPDLTVIVMNHGSRAAYDVEVVVDIVYPTNTVWFARPSDVPIGSVSMVGTFPAVSAAAARGGGYSLRWTITALPGLAYEELEVEGRVTGHDITQIPNVELWDEKYSPLEFYGEVTTSSFDLHSGNNTDRLWAEATHHDQSYHARVKPDYKILSLSVDEPNPSPGDIVNFTFVADPGEYTNIDSRVSIGLTDGLAVDEDASATPARSITTELTKVAGAGQTPAPVSYSDGVFTIGTRRYTESIGTLTATVPVRVASDAVVNEQCLTVTITGNPPPGAGPYNDDISDNVVELCLGDQPPEPLVSGRVDAFTVYPCVGITTAPCDTGNDMRVRAVDSSGLPLPEGTALIRIHPLRARIYNGHTNSSSVLQSVNDGNTVSWQTAVATGETYTDVVRKGVQLYYSRAPFAGHESDWKRPQYGISARDVAGNTPPPGKVFLRSTFSGNELRKAESPNYEEVPTTLSSSAVTPSEFHRFLEFEKLGTYKITWHAAAKRSTSHGSEDCLPNSADPPVNQAFCATETYTFHVGPIAELEVRNGGASSLAPADRNALSIVAVNNGPDTAPAARVTGLPTGAAALHISHGRYDSSTGVWNIGELRVRGYYRSAGTSEPTLVLGASAGDTARVSIASAKNYEVCIGGKSNPGNLAHTTQAACEAVDANWIATPTPPKCVDNNGNTLSSLDTQDKCDGYGAGWHTTKYYDYIASNNTATITAKRGTGGRPVRAGDPAAPGSPRTQTGATIVMWDEVGLLYGLPVESYQVEELQGSRWTRLGSISHNQYAVMQTRGSAYRVRAVNAADEKGPWSPSTVQVQAGYASPPLNLRTQADGNNAIDISWDAPDDMGGSAITGYTVQWSTDKTGSWNNAGSTTATTRTFKHRGLQTGAVRWYRVAARNSSGLGLWSDPAQGQTVSGVPNAPTLTARTLSNYQIELTWNKPNDNGQPITSYKVEHSDDGSAESWNDLDTPAADATAHTDETLNSNTLRYYRIRASNSEGNGAWSRTVSARTQLDPPSPPSVTSVEADGPNAIEVTWDEPWVFEDEMAVTQYELQWSKNQYAELWRGSRKFSSSTFSYRHTGLKPGETWHYRVRATNGGNRWSEWSYLIQSATTASANAPKAVSSFSARYDKASDQVNLTWNVLAVEGQTISYEVEHSEDGGDWRDLTPILSSSSSCDAGKCAYADTDTWPSAKLSYRVRATNDSDAGPWSSVISVTVPADPPDAPRMNWVAPDGSNHIVIGWDPPYYDGGLPVTAYKLLWCRVLADSDVDPCAVDPAENNPLADPPGYSAISLGVSARSYTHSVSPGYYYSYLLRATNGGNRWSEWSEYDVYGWNRTYAGVPAAPSLTASPVDARQIKLTWTKPNDYGSEISEYWLYIYKDGDNLYDWDNILDVIRVPADRTTWTIGNLSPGTTRHFRILALNDNGEGKLSPPRQATTPHT